MDVSLDGDDTEGVDIGLDDGSNDGFVIPVSLGGMDPDPQLIPPLPEEPVFSGEPIDPNTLSEPPVLDAPSDSSAPTGADDSELAGTPKIAINVYWNREYPTDVDLDGDVSPLDALRVINAINTYGSGSIEQLSAGWENSVNDYSIGSVDVNNDSFLSALDALFVVNAMNEASAKVVSEPVARVLSAPTMVINENDSTDASHDCVATPEVALDGDAVDTAMQDLMSYAFAIDDLQVIRARSRR